MTDEKYFQFLKTNICDIFSIRICGVIVMLREIRYWFFTVHWSVRVFTQRKIISTPDFARLHVEIRLHYRSNGTCIY